MLRTVLILTTFTITTCAWAVDAPPLPTTAKKLTGAEIEQLYAGAHSVGVSFQDKKALLTFDVNIGATKKTIIGTWALKGGKSGKVDMVYDIRGDSWCNKARKGGGKEICTSVYTDGSDVYEVDDKGIVTGKLSATH
jgi:hypothetical protein